MIFSHFYGELLELGRSIGAKFACENPLESSVLGLVFEILLSERPKITATELSHLLNLGEEVALHFLKNTILDKPEVNM